MAAQQDTFRNPQPRSRNSMNSSLRSTSNRLPMPRSRAMRMTTLHREWTASSLCGAIAKPSTGWHHSQSDRLMFPVKDRNGSARHENAVPDHRRAFSGAGPAVIPRAKSRRIRAQRPPGQLRWSSATMRAFLWTRSRRRPRATLWFQLYPRQQIDVSRELIETAQTAGAKGIVVTVDQQSSYYERQSHNRALSGSGGRLAAQPARAARTSRTLIALPTHGSGTTGSSSRTSVRS